ncbi:exonuclease domain-containing protein [Neolewinella antarctica]|uniref:Inhibitor of KinA sporulation pathway (Predicted exonuclease) n=1 Tax=Neolewinella antarctica TaxID=442734 RepID=A0ABX0X7W2_9BACT|nr:3'-5' exonuclease [Neolewinella antarctica]NJC25300.1 inhibitor of KinA sporulation pathway (predicted exonuclease) [Neolewinella antarctica]
MKFIVYDIEATCWEGRPPGMVQETIEIGAVEVDRYGRIGDQFSRLIKPVIHPQMSLFCHKLTQIDQSDLNRAQDFPRVVRDFKNWIGVEDEEYLLASWGDFDRTQLIKDCQLHRLEDWWVDEHIDLKRQYQQIKKLPKKRGLKSAVKHEGYEWEGEQHRALVDAQNTAKVFCGLVDMWRF